MGSTADITTSSRQPSVARRHLWAPYAFLWVVIACVLAPGVPLHGQHAGPVATELPDPHNGMRWQGWRGLEKDGRLVTATAYPTEWSAKKNVRWKTEIPGQGYSSPIVYDDQVFVTTAYATQQGNTLKQGARYAMFLLLLAIATSVHHLVATVCRNHPTPPRVLLHLIILELATLLLSVFVLFGEHILRYTGSGDVRSWLSSGVGVSLCLVLASSYASITSRHRRLAATTMLTFAALFLVSTPMPTRQLLFTGALFKNPLSSDSLVVFSLPLALLFAALWHIQSDRRSRRWGTARSGPGFPGNFLVVYGSLVLLLLSGVWGLSFAVRTSDYLAHHFADQSDPTPVLGWWSVGVLLVSYLLSLLVFTLRPRTSEKTGKVLRYTLGGGLSFLGTLIFFGVNFLSVNLQLSRALVALDRHSGEIQWLREGLAGPMGTMNTFNSPATPTPVVDGERVYAFFGDTGMFATDLQGKVQWTKTDLPYENVYGAVVSPVVSEGILVLVSDTPESPYITALDATTGTALWRRQRDNRGFGFNGVNRTPLVRQVNGRWLIFVWDARYLWIYDLRSGEELGQHKARLGIADKVASLVSDGSSLVLAGTRRASAYDMEALAAGEEGLRWTSQTFVGPNCASPVLARGLLFTISDWGVLTCLDASNGEKLWEEELVGEFYSSPVALGDHLYVSNTEGVTTVVAAERSYRPVAESRLQEKILASFAPASGDLLVRTETHLFCLHQGTAG